MKSNWTSFVAKAFPGVFLSRLLVLMEVDTVNRDPNGLNDHIRVNVISTKSVTLTQMRSVLFFLCFLSAITN